MSPLDKIHESWKPILYKLEGESQLELKKVLQTISYQPKKNDIFEVFSMPLNKIRIVILGQDPYYTPNMAIGQAFAVPESTEKLPPSLDIIQQELANCGYEEFNPSLKTWVESGVFLLNTALTVETGNPGSHLEYWKPFIAKTIKFISAENPCIWILWGNKAKSFLPFIKDYTTVGGTTSYIPGRNHIYTGVHPAAESYSKNAGFLGSDIFHNVNNFIERYNIGRKINW